MSFLADESNNADGEKEKSKSSKNKRKINVLAESGGVNQSNEIEDEIGQENTISSEPGNQETRKSRRKKRKSDKKAGKTEVDGVPKQQRGWRKRLLSCNMSLYYFSIIFFKFKISKVLKNIKQLMWVN